MLALFCYNVSGIKILVFWSTVVILLSGFGFYVLFQLGLGCPYVFVCILLILVNTSSFVVPFLSSAPSESPMMHHRMTSSVSCAGLRLLFDPRLNLTAITVLVKSWTKVTVQRCCDWGSLSHLDNWPRNELRNGCRVWINAPTRPEGIIGSHIFQCSQIVAASNFATNFGKSGDFKPAGSQTKWSNGWN